MTKIFCMVHNNVNTRPNFGGLVSLHFLLGRIYCYEKEVRRVSTVFNTAKYILEQHGPMSTMKLQKLCYYSQAWSLVWDDAPLFNDEIQAWVNGPVCPVLFFQTQGRFSVNANDIPGDSSCLTDQQRETISKILEYYGPHNAQWLSQLTHMESPWQEARKGVPLGAPCNNVISQESMAMYYGGL